MSKTSSRDENLQASTVAAKGFAQLVGVDRTTLFRWLKRGILPQPTLKVGRTVRWSVAAVEKFIREGVRA